jgi:hypothetical protein
MAICLHPFMIGVDKELPLDPVCRQQIDGKFRSQILTGELASSNGPAAADGARTILSAFFAWAWKEGLVEATR